MRPAIERRIAVVTGAAGGIGKASARELGREYDLILTDLLEDRLEQACADLTDEGYIIVRRVAGDLSEQSVVDELIAAIHSSNQLGALLHAAGVSSGMADWQTIIRANIVGTRRLLDALEPKLESGFVAVLIASIAGHFAQRDSEIDALIATSHTADFLTRFEPHLRRVASAVNDASFNYSGLSGPAYGVSKRATLREAALRSPVWAEKGARIVSVSPGLIWTPMGRYEVEHGEAAGDILQQTPLRRWGTAMEIAQAVAFLTSGKASFITGTDLRIDGGMVPARLGQDV